MKRCKLFSVLAVCCLVLCTASQARKTKREEAEEDDKKPSKLEQAMKEARDLGKPLYVHVGRDACGYCVAMKEKIYPGMRRDMANFVFVELDLDEKPEARNAYALGGFKGIPAIFIINWQRQTYQAFTGYKDSRVLKPIMMSAYKAHTEAMGGRKASRFEAKWKAALRYETRGKFGTAVEKYRDLAEMKGESLRIRDAADKIREIEDQADEEWEELKEEASKTKINSFIKKYSGLSAAERAKEFLAKSAEESKGKKR